MRRSNWSINCHSLWRRPLGQSLVKVWSKLYSHLIGLSLAHEPLTSHDLGRFRSANIFKRTVLLLQDLASLTAKLSHLGNHSLRMASIFIFRKLFNGEVASFWCLCKPCEQERIGRQAEESILSLLAELIHGFSDNREVNQRISQEIIILVVAVWEHEQLEKFDEFKACLLFKCVQKPRKALLGKVDKRFENRMTSRASLLLFLGLPLVKEGLVGQFIEESHSPKACSFEEEVKVLVVIAITLPRSLWILILALTDHNFSFFNTVLLYFLLFLLVQVLVRIKLNNFGPLFRICRLVVLFLGL